jgi:hypothetical protein
LNNLAPDSELRPLASERLAALRERDQLQVRFGRSIERLERLTQRWAEGLQAARKLLSRSRAKSFSHSLFRSKPLDLRSVHCGRHHYRGRPEDHGQTQRDRGQDRKAIIILAVATDHRADLFLPEPIFVKRLKIEPNQANLIRRWLRL